MSSDGEQSAAITFDDFLKVDIRVGTVIEADEPLQAAQGSLIEPLTEREMEVLGLMAQGLSNAEIASELVIAVGPVKAHTSSIYGKLEARGRTEAVLKARELSLL